MAGVYTNIAKKRAEQSRNSMGALVQPQTVISPVADSEHTHHEAEKTPVSPSPLQQTAQQQSFPKKQISAYLSRSQHSIYKQLYFTLNSTDANADKSEIVGLSLEVLSALIADETPNFPTLTQLKKYLLAKVSKL